jgi:hypothetical protein
MANRDAIAALWAATFVPGVVPARAQDQQPPLDPVRTPHKLQLKSLPRRRGATASSVFSFVFSFVF